LDTVVGSGIASQNPATQLKVEFTIENRTKKALVNYRVDYEGDGTFDLEAPALKDFDHVYTQEGLFPATVVARDVLGVEYTATYVVNVHPLPPLKSKWEKMKAALAGRDIEGAVKYFMDDKRQREIFTFIDEQARINPERPSLAKIAADMKDIELITLQGETAEYRITRDEPVAGEPSPVAITYHVQFTQAPNGIWYLLGF
jgi:hypothetical protein